MFIDRELNLRRCVSYTNPTSLNLLSFMDDAGSAKHR